MSVIKPIIGEFGSIKTAFQAGTRLARQNNQSVIRGVGNGITKVYRHTGVLPLVTGTAAGIGLIGVPGATATGIVAGIFLKKGLKNLIKLLK